MSGTINTFFSARISSATIVVGPFAPSHRILHCNFAAFLLVITFSVAAGTKISHSRVIQLVLIDGFRTRESIDRPRLSRGAAATPRHPIHPR